MSWLQDPAAHPKRIFGVFSLVFLVTLAYAIWRQNILALSLPVVFVGAFYLVYQYRLLYLLLLISIPFSLEIDLPGGLSLYVPTELLLLVLLAGLLGAGLQGSLKGLGKYFRHPLSLFLLLWIGWAVFSTLFSVDLLKSVKFLIAQAVYLGVFLVLTVFLTRLPADISRYWQVFLGSLGAVVLFILLRHLSLGLSFERVNHAVSPFFRNHVVYAVTTAYSLPFAVFLAWRAKNKNHRLLWIGLSLALLAAVIFSYTRATWLSLPVAGIYYLLIRWKLVRWSLVALYVGLAVSLVYMIRENRFMAFTPDYEKTIFNEGNLEKHLEATYKLQDVSGMERIYRWVAAIRLAADKPVTGSGPSTFYPEYRKYTVTGFRTYVSDNPEKSTTHNYFLLQFAEQGLAGGLITLGFLSYLLLWPARLYHQTRNPHYRGLVLACAACLVIIIFHLAFNELLGLDKIGSFFFISLAFLLKIDYWIREENNLKI